MGIAEQMRRRMFIIVDRNIAMLSGDSERI